MGLLHYNGSPSGTNAALYTNSGTTVIPVKKIAAYNTSAAAVLLNLTVARSLSGAVELTTPAAGVSVPVNSAVSLIEDRLLALEELILDPGDALWGKAVSLALAAPSGLAAAAVTTGGTFPGSQAYFWKITGLSPAGETVASAEATATPALNGHVNLTWSALPAGTTGVNVYRGTVTNTENVLVASLGPVLAYTDTGTAGTAGTPPAAAAVTVVAFE